VDRGRRGHLWGGEGGAVGGHHIGSGGVTAERVVVMAVMLCSRHCLCACTPGTSRKGCGFSRICGPATASRPGIGKLQLCGRHALRGWAVRGHGGAHRDHGYSSARVRVRLHARIEPKISKPIFWCPVRFLIRRNRIYRGKFDTYLEELNSPKCVEFECSYIIDNIVLVYSFMYLWYSIFIVLWSFICMYLTLLFSMKSCPNCVKLAFELDIACPCDQFVFLGKYRRTENTETKFRRYRFWKESIGTYFLRN
jgi:hypothetical protein